MSESNDPTQEPKPTSLLHVFSKSRLEGWLITALIVHVVLLGATSIPYIYDTWIDPAGAEAREASSGDEETAEPGTEQAEAANGAEPDAQQETDAEQADAKEPAVEQAGAEPAESTSETAGTDTAEPPAARTPVEKRVEDVASPDEIPLEPDDLGISLEETNR